MSGTAFKIEPDDWVGRGNRLPRISAVRPLGELSVQLRWAGSDEAITLDLSPALLSLRLFAAVRSDPSLFATVKVNDDGNALEWADGAELSAEWLAELAQAVMSNTEFRSQMDEARLTLEGMAAHLGVSRRLVADYRKNKPIPKHIALATRYLHQIRTQGL